MKQVNRVHCTLQQIEYGRKYVRQYGKEIDEKFTIDQDNTQVIDSLIQYFHGDPAFTLPGGIHGNLTKGILLMGVPGTGKSLLMELFAKYVILDEMRFFVDGKRCTMTFPIVRTEKVVNDFSQFGPDELDKYSRRRIICFDDLGEEPKEALHYGTRVNPMQQILEERYSRACITLATTNYRTEELSEMYGSRIGSRLQEMFNFIALHGPDRRTPAYQQKLNSNN